MNTATRDRPILFSAPMILALLSGAKTQTRRICKNLEWIDTGGAVYMGQTVENYWRIYDKNGSCHFEPEEHMEWLLGLCPYGQSGDRLWVKETFGTNPSYDYLKPSLLTANSFPRDNEEYAATANADTWVKRWRPSIFMPRRASRITLEIESVRVERLQEITKEDAIAEGIECKPSLVHLGTKVWRDYLEDEQWYDRPQQSYRSLWESINGPGSWARNEFVWVLQFRKL